MRSVIYTAAFCLVAGWALATLPGIGTQEAQAQKAPTGKMALVTTAFGKVWGIIRYNTSTGETFEVSGPNFQKFEESTPIPLGEYEVQAIAVGETRIVTRIEKITGRTWYVSNSKFVEVKEPAKQ